MPEYILQVAYRGKHCATRPPRRLVSSTSQGSQYSSPQHTNGDYRSVLPEMMEYQLEHGRSSRGGSSSPLSLLSSQTQLGITSLGHVARNCPYTQTGAKSEMPPLDESQMLPLDESKMPPPGMTLRPSSCVLTRFNWWVSTYFNKKKIHQYVDIYAL